MYAVNSQYIRTVSVCVHHYPIHARGCVCPSLPRTTRGWVCPSLPHTCTWVCVSITPHAHVGGCVHHYPACARGWVYPSLPRTCTWVGVSIITPHAHVGGCVYHSDLHTVLYACKVSTTFYTNKIVFHRLLVCVSCVIISSLISCHSPTSFCWCHCWGCHWRIGTDLSSDSGWSCYIGCCLLMEKEEREEWGLHKDYKVVSHAQRNSMQHLVCH